MRSKSVRLTVASLVAVLSVLGLRQSPAGAKVAHHQASKFVGPSWCC